MRAPSPPHRQSQQPLQFTQPSCARTLDAAPTSEAPTFGGSAGQLNSADRSAQGRYRHILPRLPAAEDAKTLPNQLYTFPPPTDKLPPHRPTPEEFEKCLLQQSGIQSSTIHFLANIFAPRSPVATHAPNQGIAHCAVLLEQVSERSDHTIGLMDKNAIFAQAYHGLFFQSYTALLMHELEAITKRSRKSLPFEMVKAVGLAYASCAFEWEKMDEAGCEGPGKKDIDAARAFARVTWNKQAKDLHAFHQNMPLFGYVHQVMLCANSRRQIEPKTLNNYLLSLIKIAKNHHAKVGTRPSSVAEPAGQAIALLVSGVVVNGRFDPAKARQIFSLEAQHKVAHHSTVQKYFGQAIELQMNVEKMILDATNASSPPPAKPRADSHSDPRGTPSRVRAHYAPESPVFEPLDGIANLRSHATVPHLEAPKAAPLVGEKRDRTQAFGERGGDLQSDLPWPGRSISEGTAAFEAPLPPLNLDEHPRLD
jgi:hypothetical protein